MEIPQPYTWVGELTILQLMYKQICIGFIYIHMCVNDNITFLAMGSRLIASIIQGPPFTNMDSF